jgi:hypothetical protein
MHHPTRPSPDKTSCEAGQRATGTGPAPAPNQRPEGRAVIPKSEREELARVVRLRMRVAKAAVATRQAELLADVEKQLSAKYKFGDEVWAHITQRAEEAVAEADQEIARICREMGVPENFRPSLGLHWYDRGENAAAERRAELRRLAQRKVAAAAAAAVTAIEAKGAEVLTTLIAGGLQSAEARAFLASIPAAEQLMPQLALGELEETAKLTCQEDD